MDPIVRTHSGLVRGAILDGASVFKGIPYAAPPFGACRLRPPQPVPPWSGARDTLAFGPTPAHAPYPPPIDTFLPELSTPGEDCLTLNLWSPALGSAHRPVVVWIPGGMFEYHGTSASPWYDGSRFARDGVVCVTINYRVGAEGFLDLGAGNANRGLLDQLAALEWVRDNIAVFGGDPDNVTIFGQSAGAMSVALLLAVPRARGLFRRAIAQSGAADYTSTRATAGRIAREFSAKLGVAPTREAIAALPIERVIAGQVAMRADLEAQPDPVRWGSEVSASMLPWQPVIDGEVLPAEPLERIAAGAGAGVDLLVGTNDDEQRLFLVSVGGIEEVPETIPAGIIAAYGLPVDATRAAYRAAGRGSSAGDLLAAIQTDGYWRLPAIRLADAHAMRPGAARTFMYEFAWRSPQFGGQLGASHTLEIPFVFDTLGRGTEILWGPAPPQPLADTMHTAWVAFAARGECPWPAYDPARRATMRFDTTSGVVDDPRAAERSLWAVSRTVS